MWHFFLAAPCFRVITQSVRQASHHPVCISFLLWQGFYGTISSSQLGTKTQNLSHVIFLPFFLNWIATFYWLPNLIYFIVIIFIIFFAIYLVCVCLCVCVYVYVWVCTCPPCTLWSQKTERNLFLLLPCESWEPNPGQPHLETSESPFTLSHLSRTHISFFKGIFPWLETWIPCPMQSTSFMYVQVHCLSGMLYLQNFHHCLLISTHLYSISLLHDPLRRALLILFPASHPAHWTHPAGFPTLCSQSNPFSKYLTSCFP